MKKTSLFLMFTLFSAISIAQTSIELLGAAGAGGPAGSGPVTGSQLVTFYSTTTTAFSPLVTATYAFSNQQFSFIEGNPGSPGAEFGGTISSTVNSPIPANTIYDLMNTIGSSVNTNYTSCPTCTAGTGIDVATNKAIELICFADALINASGTQLFATNARVQYADFTITFNRPVSNPLLHVTGLGGYVSYSTGTGTATINYDMGFSTDMDLLTTGVTLSKLSGNTALNVTASSISNSSSKFGSSSVGAVLHGITRTAASGTVMVQGTNITTLTFRLYLKGDGGTIIDNLGNSVSATNGNIVRWSFHNGFIPGGNTTVLQNISGDAFLVGLSLLQPVSVSGNIFNDPDAGNVNNSTGATNQVPSGLFANLIDANGKVVASTAVNTDGSYNFPAIFAGTYTMNVTTAAGTQGLAAATADLQAGWKFTGEFNGTPNTGNDGSANGSSSAFTVATSAITNINFGIQRAPESAVSVQASQTNPGGFINKTVPASAFQTSNVGGAANTLDYDGGTVSKIRITAFPDYCNSITLNGIIYTNGTTCPGGQTCTPWPVAGVIVNYTNGSGPVNPILIDPVDGTVNAKIPFAAIDNAGYEDPTPGSVTMQFFSVLAVNLKSFTAEKNGSTAVLHWIMEDEMSIDHYECQYSSNGIDFSSIENVISTNKKVYSIISGKLVPGNNYYRLKILEKNGDVTYSAIVKLNLSTDMEVVTLYPIPAIKTIHLNLGKTLSDKAVVIQLVSLEGKVITQKNIAPNVPNTSIDVSGIAQGQYTVKIITPDKVITKMVTVIQ